MERLRIDKEEDNLNSLPITNEEFNDIIQSEELTTTNKSYIPAATFDNQFLEEMSGDDYEFCQHFIQSRDIAKAASKISVEHSKLKAWELKKIGRKILEKNSVQIYLNELQEELREKYDLKKENIMQDIDDLHDEALLDSTDKDKSREFRLKCLTLKSKLGGLLINKTQTERIDKLEVRFNSDFDPSNYSIDAEEAEFKLLNNNSNTNSTNNDDDILENEIDSELTE